MSRVSSAIPSCGFPEAFSLSGWAFCWASLFWLPSLLVDENGLDLKLTGLIMALRAIIIAFSPLLGGYLSDRLKNPIRIIGSALLVLAITTPPLAIVNNVVLLISLIVINSLFVQVYMGPLLRYQSKPLA